MKTHQNIVQNRPFRRWVGIRNISDYSPFGILLKERTFEGVNFRTGFQGQEGDDEVKGDGNSVNFKYRMHDPRVGRFFAVDPLTKKYPNLTPCQFSSNSPIYLIELEGLEGKIYLEKVWFTNGNIEHKIPMGITTVPGLKSDLIKSVYFPFDNPNGSPIEVSYNLHLPNGEKGGGTGTYKVDEKPTVSDLNEIFGNNIPKVEPAVEKSFTQRFNDIAPACLKDGAMEGYSDPANLGSFSEYEKKFAKGVGQVVTAIAQGCLEYVQRRVMLPLILVDPTLLLPPASSSAPASL